MPVNIDQWGTDLGGSIGSSARARIRAHAAPTPSSRLQPVNQTNIVLENMTIPNALDPEVIRLDKWIPMLPDLHH
jgi:hypothetical protein